MMWPLLWGLHLRKNCLRKAGRATITKRNSDKMSADGVNHRTFHANHRRIHPPAAGARGDPHVAASGHPEQVGILQA